VEKAGGQAIMLDLVLADPCAEKQVVEETLKAFVRIDAVHIITGAVLQIANFEVTD
jgi:hypothetical protein